MKKQFFILSLFAGIILLSSCNNTDASDDVQVKSESVSPDMNKVRSEIEAIEKKWAEALNKRDINALMDLYADDAKSMQDGGPTLEGKAAIQSQQEKEFAAPPRFASISFQTQDLYGTHDEVTEVGTSLEKDASGKETATGKYIAVFKKVNGQYKCVREIYNKDSK